MARRLIDVTFRLEGMIRQDKESGSFVSYCPALELYSAGRTRMEAKNALTSAVNMFLRICYERQILGRVLHERNFKATEPTLLDLTNPTSIENFIRVTETEPTNDFDDAFAVEVPLHLLAAQQQQQVSV